MRFSLVAELAGEYHCLPRTSERRENVGLEGDPRPTLWTPRMGLPRQTGQLKLQYGRCPVMRLPGSWPEIDGSAGGKCSPHESFSLVCPYGSVSKPVEDSSQFGAGRRQPGTSRLTEKIAK